MEEITQEVPTEQAAVSQPQEPQSTKKPFMKTWKPWVIALALVLIWAWSQNPANSYDVKKQERARLESTAGIESNLKDTFDGYNISQDEDKLTISVWTSDLNTYSAALLALTGNTASINQVETSLLNCANALQNKADEMGTGYTIKLRLMDGTDTATPLCAIQNGEFLRHITG